jgi:hypothetical protein
VEAVSRVSEEERIAIVDLADDLQVRKQRIFKILSRLGIRPTQRREVSRGNQNVATVTHAEAAAIRSDIERSSGAPSGGIARSGILAAFSSDDVGFFYLIQLEPDHDSGRFKVGFTMDLDGRLQKHRCSAPFARYVASWPCRRVWERAAIDCVTVDCDQLHTEVFRTRSMELVSARAQAFFTMMPSLEAEVADDEKVEPERPAG